MISRTDFESGIREVFTETSENRITESSILIDTCMAIYGETVEKSEKWVGRGVLARLVYGEDDSEKQNRQRVRQSIDRIQKKLKKHFDKDGKDIQGWKISLIDNRKALAPVRNAEGKLERAYRFVISPAKQLRKEMASINPKLGRSYLGRYVGRIDEVEMFQNLIQNLDSPRRTQHILSLYGFGGMGKSSLLRIFRDIAVNQNTKVEPKLIRNEFVSKSISNWLSEIFILQIRKLEKFHQEKWRDLFVVLEPGTVVLIDTLPEVDMGEFNETLQSLAPVLKKANPECLIVTATRAKPNHGEKTLEIKGLSANDIKDLVVLRGWNPEITSKANKLQKQTGGNPLLIEFICEDEDLWTRFREGSLDLIRHSDRVAYLLNEMWNLLSQEEKEALKILSLLSHYSAKWKFSWGKKESMGIIGASWDEIAPELKAKCFIKEEETDLYEMHDVMSEFALTKIINKNELMEKMADYFSSAGKEEIAIRFHAETSHAK